MRDIDANLDAGRGLWLMGDVGTGKTTLAMIVSKAALDAGRSVAIYSLPRLLNLIRDAIETEDGMIGFLERLAAVDLLHIDDLGAENTTEWVLEQLYSIVNTRYEDERAMIVTTNLPLRGADRAARRAHGLAAGRRSAATACRCSARTTGCSRRDRARERRATSSPSLAARRRSA